MEGRGKPRGREIGVDLRCCLVDLLAFRFRAGSRRYGNNGNSLGQGGNEAGPDGSLSGFLGSRARTYPRFVQCLGVARHSKDRSIVPQDFVKGLDPLSDTRKYSSTAGLFGRQLKAIKPHMMAVQLERSVRLRPGQWEFDRLWFVWRCY